MNLIDPKVLTELSDHVIEKLISEARESLLPQLQKALTDAVDGLTVTVKIEVGRKQGSP